MKFKYINNPLTLASIAMLMGIQMIAQPTPPQGQEWEVVPEMTDEFNNGFDTVKWRKELWQYPNTPTLMVPENSGVSNGNLWIKATEGPNPTYFHSSRIYSNAQIKYPMYTESSIITAHLSAYNTFWLNNGNISGRDEIDVIENNSRPSCGCQPNFPWQMSSQYFQATDGVTVRNADNFDNRNLSANNPKRGVRWNEEYHTVGVWWKDEKNMTFYLDGEEAGSVRVGEDRSGRTYPEIIFTRELNLIWDLWTADENFLGGLALREHLRDDSVNTMRVDWVHTFRLKGSATGGNTPPPPPVVTPTPIPPTTGANGVLVIEAERFSNTGGTTNDSEFGGSGLGVNRRATNVNYVNAGDYAEYNINVTEAGSYAVEYLISTPSDNAQIQLLVDGTLASTTNVPNNGDWEAYSALNASGTINLSAGAHTIRVNASGTNFWQWNLDRITLTAQGGTTPAPIAVDGGTISGGPFTFTVGDGIADNIAQGAINLQGNTGAQSRWIITDDNGTILGLPPTPSAVNFEPAGVGTCLVWHISSEGTIGGLSPDNNINNLSGSYDLSNSISVIRNAAPPTGGGGNASLVIEAESFNNTGGTNNDAAFGGPGLGVNRRATTINYVNAGDFSEYSINVTTAGTYSIEYLISTPSNDAQIQFVVDGTLATTTNVPNNGDWEAYGPLRASGTVNLSAGAHTIRINASGTNFWQWNLDKITLRTGAGAKALALNSNVTIYPNPAVDTIYLNGTEGFSEATIYGLNGAAISSINLNTNSSFDVSQLSNGIYIVKLTGSNNALQILKVVVTH